MCLQCVSFSALFIITLLLLQCLHEIYSGSFEVYIYILNATFASISSFFFCLNYGGIVGSDSLLKKYRRVLQYLTLRLECKITYCAH